MRVLVGCEFSGVVRDAFRARGHDAISCDLLPSERPGPHIQGDLLDVLDDGWDLAVFHPPCTHLAVSGARWFKDKQEEQAEALEFVRRLLDAPIPRIALENPVSIISSRIRKPDQIIQPWQFGHNEQKKTCLWLSGLTALRPTGVVDPPSYGCCGQRFPFAWGEHGCRTCHGENRPRRVYSNQTASGQNRLGPSDRRAADRARTYDGIAEAMAEQWGGTVGQEAA